MSLGLRNKKKIPHNPEGKEDKGGITPFFIVTWDKNKKTPCGIPNTQKNFMWFQNIQNDTLCFKLNYKLTEFVKLNENDGFAR